jgi:hypothetical protein
MQGTKQATTLASVVCVTLAATLMGCGGGSQASAPPTSPLPAAQNVSVTGQYNLVLTSTKGNGTTNIYTYFNQTGSTFTGATDTLVCPSNDLSQCKGGDAPVTSITPSGTVSGTNVTIVISFPGTAGADTATMAGSATPTGFGGAYTDSLGDSGTWAASAAIHPFGPPPGSYAYSGSFNSTLNPLTIPPTISIQLGRDASSQANSNVSGKATITNSPCVSSLTLSGRALGDALRLTDGASQASIIALPTMPIGNDYSFRYKFESTAASCAGDSGRGVLTFVIGPWDY